MTGAFHNIIRVTWC